MRCFLFILFLGIIPHFSIAQKTLSISKKELLKANNIEVIDSLKLFSEVFKQNNKIKLVIIYTNNCIGTKFLFEKTIPNYKTAFGDKLDIILASSAGQSKSNINDLIALLKEYNYNSKSYFIDPLKYKEYWSYDRKKGFAFRNAICKPCKDDLIGVPYEIIFDEKGNYLIGGYQSRTDFKQYLKNYFEEH